MATATQIFLFVRRITSRKCRVNIVKETPTLQDYFELLLLSAIWGASFLFLRIASPIFGPVFLVEMRLLCALVVLLPLCLAVGDHRQVIRNWKVIFLISLFNMSIPFCLLAYATLSINAGFASILNATVPFFTAFLAYIFWRQRLSRMAIAGMLIGFSGVVLLMLDSGGSSSAPVNLLAIAAGLLAAALYGTAVNLTARYLAGVSGIAITTGSLLLAAICLLPFAWWQRPEIMPTGNVWWNVIILGVVCTGLAYVMFYRLIGRIGSSRTVSTTLLIPIFSLAWGNLFLAEQVTPFMLFSCLLVLFGVGLTTGKLSVSKLLARLNT